MNYDEALAKVQNDLGNDYVVVRVDTKPYGWMFHYALRTYVETGDEGQLIIGGGPIFVDKLGETFNVPGFPLSASDRFYRNWEFSHPRYEWPKDQGEFSNFGEPTVLSEDEEHATTRLVNTILVYAIKDKASEVRIEPLRNRFVFDVLYCINGEWREQTKESCHALVAQRIRQMAKIEPRHIEHLDVIQSGSFNVIVKEEDYLVIAASALTNNGERLYLKIEAKA